MRNNPRRNGGKYPVETLTEDEVRRLLNAPSNRAPTGIRNRAMIVLLWRAGLRIGEVIALLPKDLDWKAGTIRVLRGKGNKARTVGLDPTAWAVIQRWIDKRQQLGITRHRTLICTLNGQPLKSAYVRSLLPRLARKAGIDKRVHAHCLRHTMASEMRREGVDIGIISKQLGHSNISTTARYLDHIAPQAVIDAMARRTWG